MSFIPFPPLKLTLATLLLLLIFMIYPAVKLLPTNTSDSLLVSGQFSQYANKENFRLVRIAQDDGSSFYNSIPALFDSGYGVFQGSIYAIESNSHETRFLLGGSNLGFNGAAATNIIAIDSIGKPDLSFASGSGFNGVVDTIKKDPWAAEKYYVGGEFTTYNGHPAPGIIRLNADGSIDNSFSIGKGVELLGENNPARVVTIAFHKSEGLICFGGTFSHFNGEQHNNIACMYEIGVERIFGSRTVTIDPFQTSLGFFQMPPSANQFTPVSAYSDEVDQIEIDEINNKIYISGQFNTYATKDASGQFVPGNSIQIGNFCRLSLNGTLNKSYPYEGILAKRMSFVLDEPNAVIIGAKTYDGIPYASLIKFDRDTQALIPGFAIMVNQNPNPGSSNPNPYKGVHSKQILHGTGEWIDYIYLLQGEGQLSPNGDGYALYNLEKHAPLIRIHRETGKIDPSFMFGPINGKEATRFMVLKENDYGLFDYILENFFGLNLADE